MTALAGGAYALTYGASTADGSADVFTAIYSATGEVLVAPVNVSNTPGFDEQFATVEVQATASGSYAITWQGAGTLLNAEYLAIYQFTDDQNVDNVSVVGSNDVTIDLSAIINVGGDVVVSDNGNLVSIDLHNLASVGGNFVVSDNGALLTLTLPSLTTVGGNVDVSGNTAATTVGLGSLTTVAGSVDISGDTSATDINIGSLTSVGGSLDISDNAAATDVNIGSLTTVAGSVDISGDTSAADINIGSLTSVGGSLDISDNAAATDVNIGSLTTVAGSVDISGNTSATDINIGSLTSVGGSLAIGGAITVVTIDLGSLIAAGAVVIVENGVVELDLSALVSAGGDVSISDNHALLTVDLPDLETVDGNVDISGNTAATTIDINSLTTVSGNVDISGNDAATVVDALSLVTVGGDVTIDLAPDATVDASAFGPGGGTVRVIGDDGRETTVILGSLAQMGGLLTITTADGVALTSTAGLGTITLTGTAGDNTLIGSAAAHNVFDSGAGDDVATGGGNDDLFIGGAGDDRLDGGDGIDTAAFSGNFTDYSVTRHADGSLTVTDIRVGATDGTDTLSNIELLQFADGMLTLAEALPEPVITSDGAGATALLAITENATEVTQVAATNPNSVAALQFTIAGGTDAEKFHIDAATGELSFVVAPDFEQPTDGDGDNVYELIVQASDGFQSDTQVLDVNVTNANETPTLTIQTADQSATAGAAFSLVLPAGTFQDPDSGDHLTLTAALGNGGALPEWLAFDPATSAFSGTPGTGDAGEVDIAVTATDAGGLTATDSFHLSISAATNHAPVITSDLGGATASVIITDHTRDVTRVQAGDPDPNTRLTYAIVGGHDRALFDIDAETGELSFKKMPKDGHNYQVTVAASDGSLQDTQAINVQIAKGLFELGNAGVADTFEFAPHFGLALVEHFDATSPAHDVLDFDHRLFRNADPDASPDAAFNLIAHHSFQFGHNVVIVTDTFDTIVLRNIGLQDLTASDFHIV